MKTSGYPPVVMLGFSISLLIFMSVGRRLEVTFALQNLEDIKSKIQAPVSQTFVSALPQLSF